MVVVLEAVTVVELSPVVVGTFATSVDVNGSSVVAVSMVMSGSMVVAVLEVVSNSTGDELVDESGVLMVSGASCTITSSPEPHAPRAETNMRTKALFIRQF